ncbi:RNA-binding protein Luc7-like 2-like isoform X1 [Thraustotheca clavata]|uniref:RNA-binding protein Luc7-like 2-like isoform X1 n=1 Tax=Thraustotheca clavata TaxID=74557 RepID=A0A1V9YWW9_9STRA|nr:RNA-binding protein Luc7-like 2-like isoform X1 [Thraustotheca clavata]
MDAQRALLDELMGRNRDGDRPQEDIRDFRDARVCKRYLCGLCPHDLFQNTRLDLGDCPKLHLPKLKLAYEEDRARTKRDYGYEAELERELVRYVTDVEKKIAKALKRLEEQDGARVTTLIDVENNKEVLQLTAEIAELMQKAEDAGNEGEVDLSLKLMAQIEVLKQKKAAMQGVTPSASASTSGEAIISEYDIAQLNLMQVLPGNPLAMTNVNQKLRVCDMCGAFLSIFDSDRRLADHFGGKLHLGYMQIRKKIQEMRESRGGQALPEPNSKPEETQSTSRSSRSERERRRSRSHSRERRSSRRSRSRSRDRRRRSRSRDRRRR